MSTLRTPLHECYAEHGARLVEFAGWSLPVQYRKGVIAEHTSVRTAAGLFDVSHMARFFVEGRGAVDYLDGLLTNNPRKLDVGQLMYTALCQEDGGTIDDLVVYRLPHEFLIVANAANHDAVEAWLREHASEGVHIEDRTRVLSHLALQGPRAQEVLSRVMDRDLDGIGYYRFEELVWDGRPMIVSRNGYTGEDGFELYPPAAKAPALWRAIMAAGEGIVEPVGLGARDTLRLEVGFPLYGHELSREITPVEAGLGWVVKTLKREFEGHERLRRQKKEGTDLTLVGLEFEGRIVGRQGADVFDRDHKVGEVTSGTFGPTVQKGIALAFVEAAHSEVGLGLEVDVRGRRVAAEIVTLPFYTEGSHR
jgi:aminomethyltransferase